MKKIVLAMAVIATMASCSKDTNQVDNFSDEVVRISSGIATRASGTEWKAGDKISVFTTETGQVECLYENKKHIAKSSNTSSTFDPATSGDYIFYPAKTNIDIYASYPFADATTLAAYAIDVTEQGDHTLIDLMVAKKSNILKSADAVEMTFDHKLTQIEVTLSAKENGGFSDSDLAAATVTVGGTMVTGNYNFVTDKITTSGGADDLSLAATSNVATLMVIPQTATPEFTITVADVDYCVTASKLEMEGGFTYSYAISVSKTEVEITGSKINSWNPSVQPGLEADDYEEPVTD